MIIFGTHTYGKKNLVREFEYCQNCGIYNEMVSYTGWQWVHIYFIPVIPCGGKKRIVHECMKCKNGLHSKLKDAGLIIDELKTAVADAYDRLGRGEVVMDIEGHTINTEEFLCYRLLDIYRYGDQDFVNEQIDELEEKNCFYAHAVLQAKQLENRKKYKQAYDCYDEAIHMNPDWTIAYENAGDLYLRKKEHTKARMAYEELEKISPGDLAIKMRLNHVYGITGEYDKMVGCYEACIKAVPDLVNDKIFFKGYKKACKKVGKLPLGK